MIPMKQFILISFFLMQTAFSGDLKIGELAPDFSLTDQKNQLNTLSKMRGQWVVLYFYPKDGSPGCITEACSFRDNIAILKAKKTAVWAVSIDNNESHAEFAKRHRLPFPLLADAGGKVANSYNALLNLYLVKFAKRQSFIIDDEGKIAKIYRKVHPKTHVIDVLKDLRTLQVRSKERLVDDDFSTGC